MARGWMYPLCELKGKTAKGGNVSLLRKSPSLIRLLHTRYQIGSFPLGFLSYFLICKTLKTNKLTKPKNFLSLHKNRILPFQNPFSLSLSLKQISPGHRMAYSHTTLVLRSHSLNARGKLMDPLGVWGKKIIQSWQQKMEKGQHLFVLFNPHFITKA